VISPLTDVEFASLPERARQSGRLGIEGQVERLEAPADDVDDDGAIAVQPLTPSTVVVALGGTRPRLEEDARTPDE
jgi:hypothetical protein